MALADPEKEIPQLTGHRWYFAGVLGRGGQGTVYKVRSRTAHDQRTTLLTNIAGAVENIAARNDQDASWRLKLADALATYSQDEPALAFGALKILHLKEDSDAARQATRRFEAEIEALRKVQHPSILRLLDADAPAKWMVTELQPGQTLADSLHSYSGKPLEALRAFRPLVAAVAALHNVGVIHRDIKPGNIFVAADGHLVLGDFGIAFFEDGRDRLTETFERVGTRDWMAPWANLGIRIDDVKPTFDVFPLGKVLWCMVSGQRLLPLWYFDDQKYNQYRLTTLLPGVPHLDAINDILRRCVVQHEDDCVDTAGDFLKLVDETLSLLDLGGDILRLDASRPCRVCARGQYVFWPPDGQASIHRVITAMPEEFVLPQPTTEIQPYFRIGSQAFWFRLFACTQCGHVQMFSCPDRTLPPAWTKSSVEESHSSARTSGEAPRATSPGGPAMDPQPQNFAGLTQTILSAIAPKRSYTKQQLGEAILLALYDQGAYGQEDVLIPAFTTEQAPVLGVQENVIGESLRYLEAKGWFQYTTTGPSGQLTREGLVAAEALRAAAEAQAQSQNRMY